MDVMDAQGIPKTEDRRQKNRRVPPPVLRFLSSVFLAPLFVGCTQQPTTQPSTMYERQEQALKDPYGYNPDLKNDKNRVSGNGEFDRDGLKRDWDHVINP